MLYIIATPIGNLGDITLRAVEGLEKVEILLCEDTRVTGNLLRLLEIKNKPQLGIKLIRPHPWPASWCLGPVACDLRSPGLIYERPLSL